MAIQKKSLVRAATPKVKDAEGNGSKKPEEQPGSSAAARRLSVARLATAKLSTAKLMALRKLS
jgi:hypothetical protein